MSTDDKPLLTEWQKSDYAEDVWVRYRQDAVGKWAGVTAARKTWTVWASRTGGLVSGGCETGGIVAMRAAADAAARQWYTLPPPAGQPAAPPEPIAPESAEAGLPPDVLAAQATTLASAGKQRRFEFVPAMFALYYPAMCETARDLGYALGLHGSMARDLDVVAVPWTDEAASPEELVARLVERHKFTLKQEDGVPVIREKPHGRRGWVLWFGGHFYVDLSVMPRDAVPPAASPPPVAAPKERDPDSLPPDGYFNYDPPSTTTTLPSPASDGATAQCAEHNSGGLRCYLDAGHEGKCTAAIEDDLEVTWLPQPAASEGATACTQPANTSPAVTDGRKAAPVNPDDAPTPSPAPTEHIMQFFAYEHLPPHLQVVSKPFCDLARAIVDGNVPLPALPRNPERTVALRKLLEAKDAAVRAVLAK